MSWICRFIFWFSLWQFMLSIKWLVLGVVQHEHSTSVRQLVHLLKSVCQHCIRKCDGYGRLLSFPLLVSAVMWRWECFVCGPTKKHTHNTSMCSYMQTNQGSGAYKTYIFATRAPNYVFLNAENRCATGLVRRVVSISCAVKALTFLKPSGFFPYHRV